MCENNHVNMEKNFHISRREGILGCWGWIIFQYSLTKL